MRYGCDRKNAQALATARGTVAVFVRLRSLPSTLVFAVRRLIQGSLRCACARGDGVLNLSDGRHTGCPQRNAAVETQGHDEEAAQ